MWETLEDVHKQIQSDERKIKENKTKVSKGDKRRESRVEQIEKNESRLRSHTKSFQAFLELSYAGKSFFLLFWVCAIMQNITVEDVISKGI